MHDNSIPGLDKTTTRIILITAAILLGWSFLSSVMALGPVTASIISYGLYAFYWIYAIKTKNP